MEKNRKKTCTCSGCSPVTDLVYEGKDTGYLPPKEWGYRYFGEEVACLYCFRLSF